MTRVKAARVSATAKANLLRAHEIKEIKSSNKN
jgi:hypothetical protein